MDSIMWIILLFIIAQRVNELVIAKRNERWMKARGGIETGEKHYKWFVVLHCLFFAAVIFEGLVRDTQETELNFFLLFIFIITQVARIWCITSLGKFWNTKIIVLPEFPLIKKGPYKYVKHPNYIIVGIELFIIPLLFGAFISAIIFPVLHILLLTIRIPSEERILQR
ncbi:hypothetical protein CIL03_03145 [Virgibacillus indicus]|uniref:Isoprenylcysteine carboxyl methyltransferase n=1 Tax=Virgibacillus indicus TaxID=2024554 RepID=A0A265NDN7_9BACI|nr:isoprenylcysteine carboxylmethyltransferase family protein [Virgibacillus indicus]OZU90152.1 hypothetical protein CIL03_03145 [Virgibacillus indicus]